MIKNLSALLFASLISIGFCRADVPGYMGRKMMIKYDLGLMHPAIVVQKGMAPMVYNQFSFEATFSRAWAIGARYGFMTYKSPPTRGLFYTYYDYRDHPGINDKDYYGRFTQHTASLYFKKFPYKKGFIAPFGRYFLLGAYYQYAVSLSTELTGGMQIKGHKATAHFGGFMIGTGKNFIFARRMVMDVNFIINVPVTILKQPNDTYRLLNDEIILRNLLQLNIGFGSLL